MDKLDQTLDRVLKERFHYPAFRPGQRVALRAVMAGEPTLAILPTGAGKTLLYQLPGALLPGLVVVISPLLSLMQDQVDRLRAAGFTRVASLNSTVDYQEQGRVLKQLGQLNFLLTSPETLAKPVVQQALAHQEISLFVIDEAHCIAQWGPDFRPEYLLLAKILSRLNPQRLLMMTATATPRVRTEILARLGLDFQRVRRIIQPVNRENIFLAVDHLQNPAAKRDRLLARVKELGPSGVVYVSSRQGANDLATWLGRATGLRVAAYHAGVAAGDRYRIQEQFARDQVDLIVATSAFGMGVDKQNIRYVIHYHLPASLEAYVQEIGRAGRDNQPALADLLYAPGDEALPRMLGTTVLPPAAVLDRIKAGRLDPAILGEAAHVLTFYLNHGDRGDQLVTRFRVLAQKKAARLTALLDYVNATTCRRSVIARYFGEEVIKQARCCDRHQPDWRVSDLALPKVLPAATSKGGSWAGQLAQLLNQPLSDAELG